MEPYEETLIARIQTLMQAKSVLRDICAECSWYGTNPPHPAECRVCSVKLTSNTLSFLVSMAQLQLDLRMACTAEVVEEGGTEQ